MRQAAMALVMLATVRASYALDDPFIQVDASTRRSATAGLPIERLVTDRSIDVHFAHTVLGYTGQPVEESVLLPDGGINPSTMNAAGQIAFYSDLGGSERNHAICVADDAIHLIAVGCGGWGGYGEPGYCGDPTPLGGTFAGMFPGTWFAPVINDRGDVLFLADVVSGSSPRALFLYRAAEKDIIKVAAMYDPSPSGGQLTCIGLASMNNKRQVIFLARENNYAPSEIYLWDDGVLSKYVAITDPAPGGGSYYLLATEAWSFPDGTIVPAGEIPDINDAGDIAYHAWATSSRYGIILSHNDVRAWALVSGQPTPIGGTYSDFWAPSLNNAGDIAVFADIQGGQSPAAWIVGHAGAWRKALAFYDYVGDYSVVGLAVSRNPFNVLDECGNLVAWCVVGAPQGDLDCVIVAEPDGKLRPVVRLDDATPFGGSYTRLLGWPVLNATSKLAWGAWVAGGSAESAYLTSLIGNVPGDANDDGLLNALDWTVLPDCLLGPEMCTDSYTQRVFDADADADVDLADFAQFQVGFGA